MENDCFRLGMSIAGLILRLAPTRGVTEVNLDGINVTEVFQSTFPQGERLSVCFCLFIQLAFQSTFPQGERQYTVEDGTAKGTKFQSTFPQGERQIYSRRRRFQGSVSIHVPARGTTEVAVGLSYALAFQSTFPQGERLDELPEE